MRQLTNLLSTLFCLACMASAMYFSLWIATNEEGLPRSVHAIEQKIFPHTLYIGYANEHISFVSVLSKHGSDDFGTSITCHWVSPEETTCFSKYDMPVWTGSYFRRDERAEMLELQIGDDEGSLTWIASTPLFIKVFNSYEEAFHWSRWRHIEEMRRAATADQI